LLAIARWVAQWPDAVTLMPPMGGTRFAVFVGRCCGWPCGMGGCARRAISALAAVASLAWLTPPDMLISGDGRTVGITGIPGRSLVILRDGQGASLAIPCWKRRE
jgi:competence protein ComEC